MTRDTLILVVCVGFQAVARLPAQAQATNPRPQAPPAQIDAVEKKLESMLKLMEIVTGENQELKKLVAKLDAELGILKLELEKSRRETEKSVALARQQAADQAAASEARLQKLLQELQHRETQLD